METLNEKQAHKKSHEHSARLKNPGKFVSFTTGEDKGGKGVNFIYGIRKDAGPEGGKTEIQAIRFDSNLWSVDEAKKWLSDHDKKYIKFTAATIKEDGAPAAPAVPAASSGPAITTSNMGAKYAPKVLPMASHYGDYSVDQHDQSFMKKMKKSLIEWFEFDDEGLSDEDYQYYKKLGAKKFVSGDVKAIGKKGKNYVFISTNGMSNSFTDKHTFLDRLKTAIDPHDIRKAESLVDSLEEAVVTEGKDVEAREILNKYFSSDFVPKHITDKFVFENRSIGWDKPEEIDKYLKKLKDEGFTIKKKSYSNFISIGGVKRKSEGSVVTEGKKKKFDIYFNGEYLSSSVTDKTAKQVKDDLIASIKSGTYKHPTYADPGTRKKFEDISKAIIDPDEFKVVLSMNEDEEPSTIAPDGTSTDVDAKRKDLIVPRDTDPALFDDYAKIYNSLKPEERATDEKLAELAAVIIKKYFGEKKVQWGADGIEVMEDQLIFKNFSSSEDTSQESGEGMNEGIFHKAMSTLNTAQPIPEAAKYKEPKYLKDPPLNIKNGAKENDVVEDEEGKKFRIYNISPNWAALIPVDTADREYSASDKRMISIGDLYEFYRKVSNVKKEDAPPYEPKGNLSKDETQLINKIRYSPKEKLIVTKNEKHLIPTIISLCKKGFCNWGINDMGNAEIVLTY